MSDSVRVAVAPWSIDPDVAKDALALLRTAKRVLVPTHQNVDADALASAIALCVALEQVGVEALPVISDGNLPHSLKFLPFLDRVLIYGQHELPEFDVLCLADSSDRRRLGNLQTDHPDWFEGSIPMVNIDHHVTNERFGELNLIQPESVATCAVLTEHLPDWGLTISREVAENLATGIVTDTLGFRTSNTSPACLRQAALLMETGINFPELYDIALNRRSYNAAHYWGAGLASLKSEHGIVYGTLTIAERKASGYGGNDDADLINLISTIEKHKIGMVFVEQSDNHVKISWRALQPGVDVSGLAKSFGGGGHQAAAGADIPGTLAEIQLQVLKATRDMLQSS